MDSQILLYNRFPVHAYQKMVAHVVLDYGVNCANKSQVRNNENLGHGNPDIRSQPADLRQAPLRRVDESWDSVSIS